MDKLKVVLKRVGEKPIVKEIENTLKAKQNLVGGLIEVVEYNVGKDNLLLICNEEGKLMGLRANVIFDYDYIAGDIIIVGDDYENGDFKSLTDEQIAKAINDINKRAVNYTD